MSNAHYTHTYGSSVQTLLTPEDDFLSINVCGMKYETLKSTLARFPSTLLGNEESRRKYFVPSRQSYFFDRNRQSFEAVLYYYQSNGVLIRPNNIPMHSFAEEVSFYGLDEDALVRLQEKEGYIDEAIDLPKEPWQRKIWELFEYPDSSFGARVVACWSIFVIVVSITAFCMETMPVFKHKNGTVEHANGSNGSSSQANSEADAKYAQPWFSLELTCIIWFTLEYTIRFLSSPNKWKFMKSFLNGIDLLAILPYFVSMAIKQERGKTTFSVLRVVRLVRVFRVFKLSRHSLGLQILGQTLKASISELGMLAFFLLLGVILFSTGIYFAEQEENEMFTSIPDTFWYCIVTMTTVGYGDKVPKTLLGKIIGSLCAVSGVLTIALPVPVIVANFEFFYKRDRLGCNVRNNISTSSQPRLPRDNGPARSYDQSPAEPRSAETTL